MLAYKQKWLPQCEVSTESLAQALFLENDSFERNQISVANGIGKFFENSYIKKDWTTYVFERY